MRKCMKVPSKIVAKRRLPQKTVLHSVIQSNLMWFGQQNVGRPYLRPSELFEFIRDIPVNFTVPGLRERYMWHWRVNRRWDDIPMQRKLRPRFNWLDTSRPPVREAVWDVF